jgi:hypothetical protein
MRKLVTKILEAITQRASPNAKPIWVRRPAGGPDALPLAGTPKRVARVTPGCDRPYFIYE